MADLNRQLQEYLAQSKGGAGAKTISQAGSSTALELLAPGPGPEPLPEPGPGPGRWFGGWSSPWSRARGPSGPPGLPGLPGPAWPWWAEPDPCLPGMGRRQRLLLAALCAASSALCFGLSALYAPLLLLYGRKFALLWSLGSLFALGAAALLRGPSRLAAGLSGSPGAAVYLCALAGTLYAALRLHSTVLTALGAALQVAVIVGCVVSLLPGGSAGIRLMGGMAASALRRTVAGKPMPI